MEASRELLFFFSALGAFNGFLLAFYFLFWAKPKSQANRFFGMFLLMLSIRVAKSVFFYFNPEIAYEYLQLGLTACFFIGPFLYFYFASVSNFKEHVKLPWRQHLLVLTPIILLVNFLFPFETNYEFWNAFVIRGIYSVWVVYTILAIYEGRDIVQKILKRTGGLDKFEYWLISIMVGNILILIAYLFHGIRSYILGALLFSFLFYILLMLLFYRFQKKPYNIIQKQKYGRRKIEDAEGLISRLNHLMEAKKMYRNPTLKLPDVAGQLKILPHTLSQLLNENLDKGFPEYLNEYRIKEACDIIKTDDTLKIESIGYDVGYNSKSTFYAAFKKIKGTTPAKFKAESGLSSTEL